MKFIKYSILIYIISLVLFYLLSKYDDLIFIYAFFGIIYAPIGGIILTLLDEKFKFSRPIFYLVAIGVTIIALALNLLIMLLF